MSPTPRLSHPRRQQLRRIRNAVRAALGAALALGCAVATAVAGLAVIAPAALLLCGGLILYAVHSWRLAGRAGVGADAEASARRALRRLEREGWRLRHGLPWDGRGDIDHLAISPTGVAFAIETKTRTYHARHLEAVREQAAWLQRRRRRWCPRGARSVLCVTRGPVREGLENDVLVVGVNRLVSALRAAASTTPRPRFLAAPPAAGSG